MEHEVRVLDVGCRAAVVVNDGDAVAGVKQILVLHLLRAVRVHHDQQTAPVGLEHGLLRGNEGVFVLRLVLQPFYEQLRAVLDGVYDYAAKLALFAGYAADCHGGAHGVEVGKLVAHDEHT